MAAQSIQVQPNAAYPCSKNTQNKVKPLYLLTKYKILSLQKARLSDA